MALTFDTRLSLNDEKFQQCIDDTLTLYGCNIFYCNVDSYKGYMISGTTMFRVSNNALSSLYIGQNSGNDGCGFNNIAVGYNTSTSISIGSNNVSIGAYNLNNLTIGNNNISIGECSGNNIITGSGNVFIGKNAGNSISCDLSNRLIISNSISCNLIYGEFDNNVVTLPYLCLCSTPIAGNSSDLLLVWNSTDKRIKTVSNNSSLGKCISVISGNSILTGFTINHQLNTYNTIVEVIKESNHATVYPYVVRPTLNSVCIMFDNPPNIGTNYNVIILS